MHKHHLSKRTAINHMVVLLSYTESSFHAMIPSFHGMISSFYGMIPSFHAVYGLRQRDKSAKVIDYKGQVIRVREYLLLR